VSDVEWGVEFGVPNRVTAKPEDGVELIVDYRPRTHPTRNWRAHLIINGETAWEGANYKLSSEAKGVCEQRYRAWRKRSGVPLHRGLHRTM
jgi:hypothetical protein